MEDMIDWKDEDVVRKKKEEEVGEGRALYSGKGPVIVRS